MLPTLVGFTISNSRRKSDEKIQNFLKVCDKRQMLANRSWHRSEDWPTDPVQLQVFYSLAV